MCGWCVGGVWVVCGWCVGGVWVVCGWCVPNSNFGILRELCVAPRMQNQVIFGSATHIWTFPSYRMGWYNEIKCRQINFGDSSQGHLEI